MRERGVKSEPDRSGAARDLQGDPGLLIVNADDCGSSRECTEAIFECFRLGRITSTTAMVFMEDSNRAASIARERRLTDIGLHLNLTEPYTDATTPEDVRERQRSVIRYFRGTRLRWRRWLFDPLVQTDIDACIRDQLERFIALFGCEPSHFDGHRHVHICPNVVLSRVIPEGAKVRNSLDFGARGGRPALAARAIRRRILFRRRVTTRYFFSLDNAADLALSLATRSTVELMAHLQEPEQYSLLRSDEWVQALRRRRLGSFRDLEASAIGNDGRMRAKD
jgi:predicted glycoside hydrolase/deacetylase ChbG (UPF0249 family)